MAQDPEGEQTVAGELQKITPFLLSVNQAEEAANS
jgi:hypothetical protein